MTGESLRQRIARVTREDVEIHCYDPLWPESFEREKAHLLATCREGLLRRVEHFGSTAVPGLDAKPIVDVLVEVVGLGEVRRNVVPTLEGQGYDYFWRPTFGDDGPPFYAWFIKRDSTSGVRTHHIHMVEAHHRVHWDRLLFRDYLIAHPEVAAAYGQLKRHLAAEHPNDRVAYTRGKSEFIEGVMVRARE